MAKTKLNANNTIDTLNQDELRVHLDRTVEGWFQEEARGFTTAPIIAIGTPATGALALPAPGANKIGPSGGYAWRVERLAVSGLGTGDTISIYRNDQNPGSFIDTLTATKATIYPGRGLMLRGDQTLIFVGTGLTAAGSVVINGDATETGEPDMYKML